MQFSFKALTLATMATLAVAAPSPMPVEAEAEVEARALEARGTASVTCWTGDACNGSGSSFTVTNGGYRCVPVSGRRSISWSGSGCTVITWSGGDCRGSSFNAGTGCSGVLYGSVSVQC